MHQIVDVIIAYDYTYIAAYVYRVAHYIIIFLVLSVSDIKQMSKQSNNLRT